MGVSIMDTYFLIDIFDSETNLFFDTTPFHFESEMDALKFLAENDISPDGYYRIKKITEEYI